MIDPEAPEEKPEAGAAGRRPWVKPVLAGLALLLVAGGIGYGIGQLDRSGGTGPEMTASEAEDLAREQTLEQISREMTRRGFLAGKRAGHNHGIIAGGMAAESAVTILVRQQAASKAQSAAASARSELAAISAAPAPPAPAEEADEDE